MSDLHFNHINIIRYCDRPFASVGEMNGALVANWNRKVSPYDTAFIVGDLAFGGIGYWLRRLNGNIVLIRGSHDRYGLPSVYYQGILVIHNPAYIPDSWEGWTIHGHIHNNDLLNYPLINKERKLVNVSAELVDYEPISFDDILGLIGEEGRSGEKGK